RVRLVRERLPPSPSALRVGGLATLALSLVRQADRVPRQRADPRLALRPRPLPLLRRAGLGPIPSPRARGRAPLPRRLPALGSRAPDGGRRAPLRGVRDPDRDRPRGPHPARRGDARDPRTRP